MVTYRPGHSTTKDWSTGVETPRPTYDGAVLGFTGRTERVMSDVWEYFFYAVVWDGTKLVDVALHGDGREFATATVDATPDVVAAALAFLTARDKAKLDAAHAARVDAAVADAKRVTTGKTVVVARGRKVPKGTTGVVFWLGEGKHYGPVPRYRGGWSTAAPMRAGLKDATGATHWTAASNLDVVSPDDYFDTDFWMAPVDYTADAAKTAAATLASYTASRAMAA